MSQWAGSRRPPRVEALGVRQRGAARSVLLLAGFAAAVGLRVGIGGVGVAQSPAAGLAFGACLLALTLSSVRLRWSSVGLRWSSVGLRWSSVGLGLLGAAALCLPVLAGRGDRPLQSADGFAAWALIVTFVAVAEEVFLRGALYDAVQEAAGSAMAVGVAAAAFALLHVPLYGWHVVPLDAAVGVLLGELRRRTGDPVAPAVTHVAADLAAWFLR